MPDGRDGQSGAPADRPDTGTDAPADRSDTGTDAVPDRSDAGGGDGRAARIVADADVLAADLLAGDGDNHGGGDGQDGAAARAAMDLVRSHSWLALLASEPLLDDATAVLADLADPDLAADWRATVETLATVVEHPAGDHPALATALAGDAAHVLSFDDSLLDARAGVAVRQRVETSVRSPAAFVRVFDAASLHEAVVGGAYPGPDSDPRA